MSDTDLPYSLVRAQVHLSRTIDLLIQEKMVSAYVEASEAHKLLTLCIQYLKEVKKR